MLTEEAYEEVCQQLISKDEKSIAVICEHYGEALYGIILRIVSDSGDADEILQDTFVKIWEKGDSYNPEAGRLFTWMARIARNLSINKRNSKANKQKSKIQSDDKLVYLSDGARESNAREAMDIKGMLNKIDKKYATVIGLLYFYGYTQKEVSEELEMPLGTVKTRVKIGLRELRKLYDFGITSSILIALANTASAI